MTESQQLQRGRFSTWREQRRVKRHLALESQQLHDANPGEHRGLYGSASPYHHGGPMIYGSGGGWDGGGCGGDGGSGC